jgi:hypothetical protein
MVTAKQVMQMLVEQGFAESATMKRRTENDWGKPLSWTSPSVKSSKLSVSDETYGKKSVLYFRCDNTGTALLVAAAIEKLGGKPDFGWCSNQPNLFSLQVSAFKGWHHWE